MVPVPPPLPLVEPLLLALEPLLAPLPLEPLLTPLPAPPLLPLTIPVPLDGAGVAGGGAW